MQFLILLQTKMDSIFPRFIYNINMATLIYEFVNLFVAIATFYNDLRIK